MDRKNCEYQTYEIVIKIIDDYFSDNDKKIIVRYLEDK